MLERSWLVLVNAKDASIHGRSIVIYSSVLIIAANAKWQWRRVGLALVNMYDKQIKTRPPSSQTHLTWESLPFRVAFAWVWYIIWLPRPRLESSQTNATKETRDTNGRVEQPVWICEQQTRAWKIHESVYFELRSGARSSVTVGSDFGGLRYYNISRFRGQCCNSVNFNATCQRNELFCQRQRSASGGLLLNVNVLT